MTTKIAVCGAAGRMGRQILMLASASKEFAVSGAIETSKHPMLGRELLPGIAISSSLSAVMDRTDVVIDFSTPVATLQNAKTVAGSRRAMVIGTTGITMDQIRGMKRLLRRCRVVQSTNMSVGVNLLRRLVREAAGALSGYDAEIIEAHHHHKQDSPSGTARSLAEDLAFTLNRDPRKDFVYGREGLIGPRKPREIGIHAVRAGDIVGDHTVLFAGPGERLELIHRAHSRETFAAGALRAAAWAVGQKPGWYGMEDVLFGSSK